MFIRVYVLIIELKMGNRTQFAGRERVELALYRLISKNREKVLELNADGNSILVTCCTNVRETPYYVGELNDMLFYSEGRPWMPRRVELEKPTIRQEQGCLNIEGMIFDLQVLMRFAFDSDSFLRIELEWANHTGKVIQDLAVGFMLQMRNKKKEKITIPHMIYNNNPSADPGKKIPHIDSETGSGFICEEHRLPIPCVNREWMEGDQPRYFSLFSQPSHTAAEGDPLQYGTLGAWRDDNEGLVLCMTSGVLMFNGVKDIVYVGKSRIEPYDYGYLECGQEFNLKKSCILDWGQLERSGWGFRNVVKAGNMIFKPSVSPVLSTDSKIRLKIHAMDDRWRNREGASGYVKFNDSNAFGNASNRPMHFMYGWTGQCLKLAWCDAKFGISGQDEVRVDRCRLAVDFYLQGSGTEVPGLRHVVYRLEDKHWHSMLFEKAPAVSSRAYGEAIMNLAEIVALFMDHHVEVPQAWMESLTQAADFFVRSTLPEGIFPMAWTLEGKPVSSMVTVAGIPCVMALVRISRLVGEPDYLKHAEKIMASYDALHAQTFDRPFARSTLDAKCEDKEAGMYFFQAAYELYAMTQHARYREMAELSADWILSYVFVWNPEFDPELPLAKMDFKAAGWPGVSVQNHHLDVFFPMFDLWKFGKMTENSIYEQFGKMIFDAVGQGICTKMGEWGFSVIGEQGEGFYQTNYHGRGHSNTWNPSWVIALVLQNALLFQEYGEG